MKNVDFVVIKYNEIDKYLSKGGVGYRGPELKELGFPFGPYSRAGAETLVRQMKTVNPKLRLRVVPYLEKE